MAGKEKTILQLDGEINLKADKAKQSMQELKKLLDEFKGKTIDIKAQTRSARMSIQNLGDFISRTFNRENTVKLATADAQAKVDRLATTLKSFKDNTKITLSLDARGVSSQLQSIRNDLNFITGKHTISINASTQQVKSQLTSLAKDINNIKNVSFTVNVKNNADIKGINTFTKDMSKLAGLQKDITFGITVKSVQNSLDRVRQVSNVLANLKNNNSIQFTESGLNPILGKLKNMELYLRSIKQNSKIKIEASGAKDLPKLKVEADQSDLFAVEKRLAIITNQIRRINRMTLKVNSRYNNRSGGGGGSRGGRSADNEQLGNRWFNSSFFTQFVHFVGRSSKGFGSFGEATADVLAKWQAAGGALGRFASLASIAAAGIAAFSAGITLVVGSLNVFANILTTIGRTIYTALQPGIELYKQQTSAVFSFTAALQSNAKYLDQPLSRNDARGLSQDLINRATLDAEMSAFSLEELLRSLQGTLPILLSRGMSLDQAYEVNKGVAGVAKMTQLTPSQILQETRDLAQGSITSRGSQVANALGITNADINKYKGDVEGLYNFLMEKFANYSELLQQYEDTALGRYQQLEERWQSVTKTLVDGVADQFKGIFEYLINATGQWVDKEGNILNALTGKWEDAQGNIFNKDKNQWENPLGEVVEKSVDNVGKNPVFQLSESLQKLIPLFQDIVNYTTELVDGFTEFVSKTFEGEDPIKVIKEFIFACLDGLFLCAKILVILIDSFVDAKNESGSWLNVMDDIFVIIYNLCVMGVRGFKEIALAIAGVIGAALKLGKILGPIISGIGLLHGNLVMAAAGAALTGAAMAVSNDIDAFIAEKNRLQEELHKEKPNYISSASDLLIKPKDGDLTKRVRQTQAEEEAKRVLDLAKNQHLDPKSAKGTAQNKEDEKARKKAIKDAQKAMKEHIQGLKEQLKDHIAELKETLAKNKIAFDEGFMTIKDYYTQKAQIEAEEAQARLEEAQAEKAAILATPYENQADQLKALHTVNREIREYTRAVEKTTRAQKEIADFIKKSADTWADIKLSSDTMFNSNNAVKPINGPLNAENTAGMSNTEILYRLFTTTGGMNDAMAKGIIASLMGESTKELRTDIIGDNGTSFGLAQWHNERWTGLNDFANANNSEILHPLTQGNYLLHELLTTEAGSWAEALKYFNENGQTAEAMTYAFTKYVERPADKEGQGIARQENLAKVLSDLALAKERPSQVQTIPSQYNKYGIDTRYTDIENTLRPNEIASDLGNLQQYVKDLHNLIAKEYSEATGGKKLSINIATAGNHPSNSSPWGHKYGYKIDYDHTGVDYDTLGRIFNKYGVAGVIEGGTHIDASYGKGYVGEGRLLTNSETGTEAFNRYSKGSLASTQLTQAMTTEASHELQNMVKDAQKRLREAIVENESFLFDQYSRQLDALVAQMNEEIAGKNVQMLEPAERDSMVQQIKVKYQRKMTDLIVSATEKTIDYNLNKIEDDFKLMLTEVKVGRLPISAIGGRINNVINYFWNINGDNGGVENGVWGIFTYLERLMTQAQEYLKAGNMQAYQQTMNKVRTLKDESFEVVNSWVDGINKIFDHAQDLFDTSDKFTNLQREFGDRELKAIQAQQLYSIYSDHEAELRRLRDSAKEVYDTALNAGKINEAKEAYRNLVNIESQLWDTTAAKEKMRLVAEQYPNYLHDLRKTAKQALEDGLVTFLTDGVNEAENLGEALRNLAISFLKEIQQMSAKWMVKSLMTQWFGGWNVDDPNSLSLDTTGQKVAAGITGAGQAIIDALNGVALGINGQVNTAIGTARVAVNGYSNTALVPGNTMLNMSYDEYMNKQKNQYSFNKEDLGLKDFTKGFKSSINEFKLSNDLNTQALNTTAQVNTALNATTQANTATTQAETVATQAQTTATTTATTTEATTSAQKVAVEQQNNNLTTQNNAELSKANANLQQANAKANVGGAGAVAGGANAGALGAAGAGSSAVSGFKGLGGGGFFNGGIFQNILGAITDFVGSAFGQLAGDFLAIKSIFSGDTKEKLLGTIFLEIQLLYIGQQQQILWLQQIATRLSTMSAGFGFAKGGYISGKGTSTSDSIPTMLSNSEYVIRASSVKKYGRNFMDSVNNGTFSMIRPKVNHYAQGGLVSDLAQEQTARGISNFGKDISNNISNTANISVALVRDEQEGMKQLLRSPEGQRIMLDFSRKYASVTSRF